MDELETAVEVASMDRVQEALDRSVRVPSIDPLSPSTEAIEKVNADWAERQQAQKRRLRAARTEVLLTRGFGERLIGRP